MPRPMPAARTSVFLATLSLLLLTHGGHFYSYDSYVVYRTATQLVDHGTLDLTPMWGAVEGADGGQYGRYGIGLSLLQLVPAVLGRQVDRSWPESFTRAFGPPVSVFYPDTWSVLAASLVGVLAGALAAAETWSLSRDLGHGARSAAWVVLLLVLGTQLWPAARDGFPHVVVLLLLVVAVRRCLRWSSPARTADALWAGGAIGLLGLVRPFDAALVAPVFCIFLLLRNGRRLLRSPRAWLTSTLAFSLPIVAAVASIAVHNHLRFGSPLSFDQPGTQSFTTPLLVGLRGLIVSPEKGLLWYSPPLLASPWGLWLLYRRRPVEAGLLAALIALFPLGYATYTHWDGGICWGPRYVVPLVPLAVVPLGDVAGLGRGARLALLVLGLGGLAVQVLGTAVDFQRARLDAELADPTTSMIVLHAHAALAARHLDWMVARLWQAPGAFVALLYAAVTSMGVAWGVLGVRRAIRIEETFSASPLRVDADAPPA